MDRSMVVHTPTLPPNKPSWYQLHHSNMKRPFLGIFFTLTYFPPYSSKKLSVWESIIHQAGVSANIFKQSSLQMPSFRHTPPRSFPCENPLFIERGFLLTFSSDPLYRYLLTAVLFQEASCVSPPSFKKRPFHIPFRAIISMPQEQLPEGVKNGHSFSSVCINPASYLPWLVSQAIDTYFPPYSTSSNYPISHIPSFKQRSAVFSHYSPEDHQIIRLWYYTCCSIYGYSMDKRIRFSLWKFINIRTSPYIQFMKDGSLHVLELVAHKHLSR